MRILMISDVYFPRINGVSTSIAPFCKPLQATRHRVMPVEITLTERCCGHWMNCEQHFIFLSWIESRLLCNSAPWSSPCPA